MNFLKFLWIIILAENMPLTKNPSCAIFIPQLAIPNQSGRMTSYFLPPKALSLGASLGGKVSYS
jgi:hypothetical protein